MLGEGIKFLPHNVDWLVFFEVIVCELLLRDIHWLVDSSPGCYWDDIFSGNWWCSTE